MNAAQQKEIDARLTDIREALHRLGVESNEHARTFASYLQRLVASATRIEAALKQGGSS